MGFHLPAEMVSGSGRFACGKRALAAGSFRFAHSGRRPHQRHTRRPCGCIAQHRNAYALFPGEPRSPYLSSLAGARRKQVSSPPPFVGGPGGLHSLTSLLCTGYISDVHAAATYTGEVRLIVGRAAPSQTLPAGRGLGKPGFPMSQPLLGTAGIPTGRGMGKPGFPVCSHQEDSIIKFM